ncbi:MAG TPA: NAD(P)-dependent oxidoreductase [Candidatus Methylomirabilis sp.]|nr:NAD(P)-dependent oxidoreductase [Candidatus Methylomirabilis sp.]
MRFERVLVTGGAGRLGRHVVAELARHCRVTVVDRDGASATAGRPIDVLDLGEVTRAMADHDAVVHLAAIDSSVTAPPEVVFDTNVRGTWNVLHAARAAGLRRAVIASSVAATGLDYTNPGMPPLYLPIDESHPLRPSQPYGLSKELDEAIARSFGRRGEMEVVCLRPSWILFPEAVRRVTEAQQQGEATGSPPSSPAPGRHREPLPILRSWVGPEDAARAFRLALERERLPRAVFFVTAAETFEPGPTLPYLEGLYGALPEVRKPEVYARNPRASAFDISAAREILGWSPSVGWAELSAGAR